MFTTEVVITMERERSHWEVKLMAYGDVRGPDDLRKTFEFAGSVMVPFTKTKLRKKRRRFVSEGEMLGWWKVHFEHNELVCL